MRKLILLGIGATALLGQACSSEGASTGTSGGGSGGSGAAGGGGSAATPGELPGDEAECAVGLCPPEAAEGFQLAMNVRLEPGQEDTFCQYELIDEATLVGRMEHRYTNVSHHFLLYPTTLTPENIEETVGKRLGEAFSCNDVPARQVAGMIYSTQTPTGLVEYPEQTAYSIPDRHVVMMEYHAINTTPDPVDAKVRMNLERAHGEIVNHAGTLFFYNYSILIPPLAPGTARMRCEIPRDMEIMAGASHMHRRGTSHKTWLKDADGTEIMQMYDTTDWSEPTTATFDPVLQVSAGQFIEFECGYQNDEDRTVIEGPHTTNEMCMSVWLYYAPKESAFLDFGTRLCFSEGSGPLYDGTHTCTETRERLDAAWSKMRAENLAFREAHGRVPTYPDDYSEEYLVELEEAWVGTSRESSQAIHDLFGPVITGIGGCATRLCGLPRDEAGELITGDDGLPLLGPCTQSATSDECQACLEERCPAQLAACDAAN
jgi:hypothetical protein